MRYGHCLETRSGALYLEEEEGVLVRLSGGKEAPEEGGASSVRMEETAFLREAGKQVREYLEQGRREFTIPLRMQGTDFQKRVWRALMEIPYGEVRTYGQIAAAAGCPGGARAVGQACNKNRIILLIPCHRVIGGKGGLVGFGCGLPMKEALLKLERQSSWEA